MNVLDNIEKAIKKQTEEIKKEIAKADAIVIDGNKDVTSEWSSPEERAKMLERKRIIKIIREWGQLNDGSKSLIEEIEKDERS